MPQTVSDNFYVSYHIQNVLPYADLSRQRCHSCIFCGKSIDEIKQEKINWYMERSTPRSEPVYITALRREAYSNGLNAGSSLFLAPAVSHAAACDGTRITTTTQGQETASGTLPIYLSKEQSNKLLHYFVALNMLHFLTLLSFLIYIRVRISLLNITIERLSWY